MSIKQCPKCKTWLLETQIQCNNCGYDYNISSKYSTGLYDVVLKAVDCFGNPQHWFYTRSVLSSKCNWSFDECDTLECRRNFPVKVATFCSLEQALSIRDSFKAYGDTAEIVNSLDNNNTNTPSMPSNTYFDETDDEEEFDVQLRTNQTPFSLEAYDSTGSISNRYSITNISYNVTDGLLHIDVEGRMTYQRSDIHWSIDELQWILTLPDRTTFDGTEFINKLSPGEYFEFQIEEYISESGTYILRFKMQ